MLRKELQMFLASGERIHFHEGVAFASHVHNVAITLASLPPIYCARAEEQKPLIRWNLLRFKQSISTVRDFGFL